MLDGCVVKQYILVMLKKFPLLESKESKKQGEKLIQISFGEIIFLSK